MVDGNKERSRLPMDSCAGDLKLSTGVFLCSRMARCGSLPSSFAFFRMSLAIWTVFSTRPLDLGYVGLDVTCLKFHSDANLANSDELYCVPLSDLTISGMPCLDRLHVTNNSGT